MTVISWPGIISKFELSTTILDRIDLVDGSIRELIVSIFPLNIFKEKQIFIGKEMAFTCGSGVTACILGLANSIISGKKPIIYDGSWAEYGLN